MYLSTVCSYYEVWAVVFLQMNCSFSSHWLTDQDPAIGLPSETQPPRVRQSSEVSLGSAGNKFLTKMKN